MYTTLATHPWMRLFAFLVICSLIFSPLTLVQASEESASSETETNVSETEEQIEEEAPITEEVVEETSDESEVSEESTDEVALTEEDTEEPTEVTEETVVETETEVSASDDESEAAPLMSVAEPTLTTDKADYAPTEAATIFGNFFSSFYTFILKIVGGFPDGSSEVTHTDTVTTDEDGSFEYVYQLDGTYRPDYTVTALDIESGDVVAETTFTDAPALASATVGGGSSVSVSPSASITAAVTGSSPSGTGGDRWYSTSWRISATPGAGTCVNTTDVSNTSATRSFPITAPASSGTYNVYFQAFTNDSCGGTSSAVLTLSNAVVVTSAVSNQTITVTTPAPASATYGDVFAVAANSSSALPVAITTSGSCSGSGSASANITMTSGTGSCTVHYNQAGNGSYNPAPEVTNTTSASKKSVTASVTADDKIYDNTTDATISNCSLSGVLPADAGNVTCTAGSASFDDEDADTNKTVTATGITLGGSASGNYSLSATSDTDEADITTRPITVTATTNTKTYDGDTTAIAEPTITVGTLASGDTADFTEEYATADAGTGKTLTPSGDVLDGNGGDNYDVTFIDNTTGVIEQAEAVCDVEGYSDVYDAAPHGATGACTGVLGESDVLGGLSLGSTFTDVPGGSANWTFTGGTNYEDQSGSVDIVITQAPLEITAGDGQIKMYGDGDPLPFMYEITDGELFGSDALTGSLEREIGEDVGLYTLTQGTLTAGPNYAITFVPASFEITSATSITTVVCSPSNIMYTGSELTPCTASYTTSDGQSGPLPVTYTGNINVGLATATAMYDGDSNHMGSDDSETFEITKAPSVTVVTFETGPYTYRGSDFIATAQVTGAGGLDVPVDVEYTGDCENVTLADGCTATATYEGDANHEASAGEASITIVEADQSIDFDALGDMTYGDPDFDLVADASSNLAVAFSVSGNCSLTGVTLHIEGVGTCTVTATQAGNGNYNPATDVERTFNIGKATPVCTVTEYTEEYSGTPYTAEGSCVGVGNEPLTGLDLASTTHTDAGVYDDTWTFTGNANYTDASGPVTNTITKKELMMTAENADAVYSDPLPALSVAYTGFVDGENATELDETGLVCTTDASIDIDGDVLSPAGEYATECDGVIATNYAITAVPGELTVTQEDAISVFNGTEGQVFTAGPTISSAPVQLSANLTELFDGHSGDMTLATVTFTLTPNAGPEITKSNVPVDADGNAYAMKSIPVGTYTVTVTVSDGNSYWVSDVSSPVVLNIALGSNEKRVTGGGWVVDPASANDKDNFGFTVNYNKTGAPKGNFVFTYRGEDGYDYKLKSNSWAKGGLSFTSANEAYFTGKATLEVIDQETGLPVSSDGSYSFAVNATDGGPTKTADKIAFTILDGAKKVWKKLGTSTNQNTLGGGNIVVQSK